MKNSIDILRESSYLGPKIEISSWEYRLPIRIGHAVQFKRNFLLVAFSRIRRQLFQHTCVSSYVFGDRSKFNEKPVQYWGYSYTEWLELKLQFNKRRLKMFENSWVKNLTWQIWEGNMHVKEMTQKINSWVATL